MQHLEIVTHPSEEPITLAEAKLHLRVDFTDDDSLITGLITSARMRAELDLKSTLVQTVYDLFLDDFPSTGGGYLNRTIRQFGPGPNWLPNGSEAVIPIPNPPLVSVATVKYFDPTGVLRTIDSSTYTVSTGNGSRIQPLIGYTWPVARPQLDAVAIRFTAGFASAAGVPENVKSAMKLMIGNWYEHREEVSDAATYPVPSTVVALLSATDPGIYS